MRRIFVKPDLLSASLKDKTLLLSEQEQKRFYRILRLSSGDRIEVFDGSGRIAFGVLSGSILRDITIVIDKRIIRPNLRLYQALVGMIKLETIVRYSTQLGVAEIVLFNSLRSEFNTNSRILSKIIRLRKIAEDYSRQSGRLTVPEIRYAFFPFDKKSEKNYICVPKCSGLIFPKFPASLILKYSNISIIIGPEGGFSNTEINRYLLMGGEIVLLSNNILRVELAGLVAIAYINKSNLTKNKN